MGIGEVIAMFAILLTSLEMVISHCRSQRMEQRLQKQMDDEKAKNVASRQLQKSGFGQAFAKSVATCIAEHISEHSSFFGLSDSLNGCRRNLSCVPLDISHCEHIIRHCYTKLNKILKLARSVHPQLHLNISMPRLNTKLHHNHQ